MTVTLTTGLTSAGMVAGARELASAEARQGRLEGVSQPSLPDIIAGFIPANILADLTGARDNSIISVVVFGVLAGIPVLLVGRDKPEHKSAIHGFINSAQAVVLQLVRLVMSLTPSGIPKLIRFVLASYAAIALMFGGCHCHQRFRCRRVGGWCHHRCSCGAASDGLAHYAGGPADIHRTLD